MIAALLPSAAYGDTLPLLRPSAGVTAAEYVALAPLLLANLCAMSFDYLVRQKVQGRHLHWFVVEQLLVIVPEKFAQPLPAKFLTAMRKAQLMNGHHANPTVADFVIPQVLALSYTAHDLAPFARDLGYVDDKGKVLPPFVWNDEERRARMAALDAVFFWLYGLSADDAAYIMDSFPIVREQDERACGHYRTRTDVLALLALMPAKAAAPSDPGMALVH